MVKGRVKKSRRKRWSEWFLYCQNPKCVHTEDNHTSKKHYGFGLCSACYWMFDWQDRDNKTSKILEFKLKFYKEAVKQLYEGFGIKVSFGESTK